MRDSFEAFQNIIIGESSYNHVLLSEKYGQPHQTSNRCLNSDNTKYLLVVTLRMPGEGSGFSKGFPTAFGTLDTQAAVDIRRSTGNSHIQDRVNQLGRRVNPTQSYGIH